MGDWSSPDDAPSREATAGPDSPSPPAEASRRDEPQTAESSETDGAPTAEPEHTANGDPPTSDGDGSPPGADPPLGGGSPHENGDGGLGLLDELLVGLLVALVLAGALFGLSGVWPPMVAVESESMEPNLYRGDLVFVAEEHRYGSSAAVAGTGVVPARVGESVGYESFGAPGDVIVFVRGGGRGQVIHRAQFWVNESENWYGKADPAFVSGEDCEAVPNCPAPHEGFVTKGDDNDRYDQVEGISDPVRPSSIRGTAEYKVPYLGRIRLAFGRLESGSAVDVVRGPLGVAAADTVLYPVAVAATDDAAHHGRAPLT